jgi:hypothetical protein
MKNIKQYDDSLSAWEGLNEDFIMNKEWLQTFAKGGALYSYDTVIHIRNPKLDPNIDFGRLFNYTKAKWSQLVRNYIDNTELFNLKREVEDEELNRNNSYAIAMQFTNSHKHGKSCLLSMVFSRRPGISTPNITVFLRASEVTKRLLCDLLLFQRIGEYVYDNKVPFTLTLYFNQIFNDDAVLLMYHAHKDVFEILGRPGIAQSRVDYMGGKLEEFLRKKPEDVKYKIHRRVVKVLRSDLVKYPVTLAGGCLL